MLLLTVIPNKIFNLASFFLTRIIKLAHYFPSLIVYLILSLSKSEKYCNQLGNDSMSLEWDGRNSSSFWVVWESMGYLDASSIKNYILRVISIRCTVNWFDEWTLNLVLKQISMTRGNKKYFCLRQYRVHWSQYRAFTLTGVKYIAVLLISW